MALGAWAERRKQYAERIKKDYFQAVKNIEYKYEQNIENIKHNLKLCKMEITQKLEVDTAENKYKRLDIEEQYQDRNCLLYTSRCV